MKPLKLKMKAFGAFAGEVDLDFEKGLGKENFFLIHGATGSGKTTILDAICYALYDETSGGDRKGAMMRSEHAEKNLKTEVDFTFRLGEKIYRVRRLPKQDGIKNMTAELFCGDEKISEKSAEVTPLVEELLGFECKQFRQVVILPQGDFKKFLTAKSDDREELLNLIFDANVYKLIEENLKKKSDDLNFEVKKLIDLQKNYLNEIQSVSGISAEAFNLKMIPELAEKLEKSLAAFKSKVAETKKLSDDAGKNLTAAELLDKDFENFAKKSGEVKESEEKLKKICGELERAKVEFDKRKSQEPEVEELKGKIIRLTEISKVIQDFFAEKKKLAAVEEEEKILSGKVKKSDDYIKACEETMNTLKTQEKELRDAGKNLVIAKQKLTDAEKRDEILKNISKLENESKLAEKKFAAAEENYKAAQKKLEQLRYLQKEGSAAILAATLEEGKPCPVCGSTHHPQKAVSKEIVPTENQIKEAEIAAKNFEAEKSKAEKIFATAGERLKNSREMLESFSDTSDLKTAQENFEKAKKDEELLKHTRERMERGKECTENALKSAETTKKNFDEKSKAAATLRGTVAEKQKLIPEEYADNPEKLTKDLQAAQILKKNLEDARKKAEEFFHGKNGEKSEEEGKLKSAKKYCEELAKKIEGKVKPDLPDLREKAETLKNDYETAIRAESAAENNLNALKSRREKIEELGTKISDTEKIANMWTRLSNVSRGIDTKQKISFRRYHLRAMFREIVNEANNRLEKMSDGRYKLVAKDAGKTRAATAGLNLEIHDFYTGNSRPVETLSGGESFLASLALALGLAATVKNTTGGIKLDTIFIDEGFGTLDTETLDTAMKALLELGQGGKLVGIISHVEELKQQIPVKLTVTKTKHGSYATF